MGSFIFYIRLGIVCGIIFSLKEGPSLTLPTSTPSSLVCKPPFVYNEELNKCGMYSKAGITKKGLNLGLVKPLLLD